MMYRIFQFTAMLLGLLLVLLGGLFFLSNVSTKLTDSDIAVFEKALRIDNALSKKNYNQELDFIKKVQTRVMELAPGNVPIPEFHEREPADLLNFRSGLCYDRSRTLDKVFEWYGFESRHVFILFVNHPVTGEKLSFWSAFFTPNMNSHAVTEVKTSRGWIVVDSNTDWISVTEDGAPVSADQINLNLNRFKSIPVYWTKSFWPIRGLYSRRGHFYPPYIYFPELNLFDLVSWLLANNPDPVSLPLSS